MNEIPMGVSDRGSAVRSRGEEATPAWWPGRTNDDHREGNHDTTATYTFDVFASLDGYGSHRGNWGGYWGKQGPQLLERRLALYDAPQRMVFGANTYRQFARLLDSSTEETGAGDPWVARMRSMPATVLSTTMREPPQLAERDRRAR